MTSSYTVNNGLEKPEAGDQEGAWGGTLNTNFDIIDRVLSGVGSVSLSGTTHTLTTTDGTLTDGMYRVLLFTGALGANNTVTISPNDQDKLYFIVNNTTDSGSSGPYSVIIKQGTGATVTVENGRADIVYADGAGSGAAVVSLGTEIGQRAFDLYTYTATAGQTTFTGSDTSSKTLAYSAGNLFVTLNGVTLENGTDYTATNGTSVVLTDAATVGDELNIYAFNAFSVANVTTASGDFSIGDDLSFTSDGAIINMGADSDVTITHNADEGITLNSKDISGVSSINGGQVGGSRNFIYNGDMAICQRATSAADVGGSSGYFVQDRWRSSVNNMEGRFTMSQDTETPDGFANSMKIDCTTAETSTPDVNEYLLIEQRFEGLDLQSLNKGDAQAKALTVSFYVRSPKTGVHTVSLYDESNSRIIGSTYTIASADTWEKHSVSFAGDTSGAIPDDSTVGLALWFWLLAGSDYTGGTFNTSWASYTAANTCNSSQVNVLDNTSNNFYLTGVQMELGDTASIFQNESYGENLARCQRYYQIVGLNTAAGNSSNNMYYTSLGLSPSMNHDPTIEASYAHGLLSGNFQTRVTSTFGNGVTLIDSTPESVVVRGGTSSSYNWIRGNLHMEAEL